MKKFIYTKIFTDSFTLMEKRYLNKYHNSTKPKLTIMKSLISFFVLLALFESAICQYSQQWVSNTQGPNTYPNDYPPMVIDSAGNSYVAGFKGASSAAEDYVVVKYDSSGIQQWLNTYNGPANNSDRATSIVVHNSGNVYVTGYSMGSSLTQDYLTLKYSPSGSLVWSRRYNGIGNGDDFAYSIAVDDSQNVYVTGTSIGNGTYNDYLTIKYNPAGTVIWIKRYNDPANLYDIATVIRVDKFHNVYVTGASFGITTIKYNISGDTVWKRSFGYDTPQMEIDDLGNVYVSGMAVINGSDYCIAKYDSSGTQQWLSVFSGYGNEYPTSLAIDKYGNSVITGQSNDNFGTVKFNASGIQQWSHIYNGTASGVDRANSVAMDTLGNVFVTGSSSETGRQIDITTIKYGPTGSVKWINYYNGFSNNIDKAGAIKVNPNGTSVYIAGFEKSGVSNLFCTVKYRAINNSPVLKLTLLIEGMYDITFDWLNRRDSVTVYLRQPSFPFGLVDSSKALIDSLRFNGIFRFPNAQSGTYYLVIKHLNSIETWSRAGGEIVSTADTTFYNFTDSQNKAYGNNLKLVGERFCVFSGDVNKSEFVDITDLLLIDNDVFNFVSGQKLPTDLNGDNSTDITDLLLCDNNVTQFISVIRP